MEPGLGGLPAMSVRVALSISRRSGSHGLEAKAAWAK
jgi:hypothetical protein